MNINISKGINSGTNKFITHIQNNFILYLLSFVFICIGIIMGFLKVRDMSNGDKMYMINWIKESLNFYNSKSISKISIFFTSMKNYLPIIIFIWFLGLTIIGTPLVLIVNMFKGYAVGFTFSFIINNFGVTGIWVGIGSILLQNIIFLPCIMIMSVYSMEFSLGIISEKSFSLMMPRVVSYCLKFIMIFFIMILGFLIETYITPYILNFLSFVIGV